MQGSGFNVYFQILLFLSVFNVIDNDAIGQVTISKPGDDADQSLNEVIKMYDHSMKQNSFIYSGRVYNDKYLTLRGHQFFKEDFLDQGKMIFEGESFNSVYLMYDIYNDIVLVESYDDKGILLPLILDKEKITSMELQDHQFIYLAVDSISGIKPGLYDLLYDGQQVKFYSKRRKKIKKTSEGNAMWESFIDNDAYYIEKDGNFFRIGNKSSLIKVLSDHKSDIKGYIRKRRIYIKADFETGVILTLDYYDSLP